MTEDLRYPVGKFERDTQITPERRAALVEEIAGLPAAFSAAAAGLSESQLDTPYRPGGWTVRQVIHHVPDSHMNAYIRCKLAVTEDNPTVKTYDEARWAEQSDSHGPTASSLTILDAVHARWVSWLRSLEDAAFARPTTHPDMGTMTVSDYVQMYAWHGRHHTAHITGLRQRMGW